MRGDRSHLRRPAHAGLWPLPEPGSCCHATLHHHPTDHRACQCPARCHRAPVRCHPGVLEPGGRCVGRQARRGDALEGATTSVPLPFPPESPAED